MVGAALTSDIRANAALACFFVHMQCIALAEMLVVDDTEFAAESGTVLETCSGEQFTIVCGADICAVQIQAPFHSGSFLPEYDLLKGTVGVL